MRYSASAQEQGKRNAECDMSSCNLHSPGILLDSVQGMHQSRYIYVWARCAAQSHHCTSETPLPPLVHFNHLSVCAMIHIEWQLLNDA